jgi:hypothetical protein
VFHLSLYSKAPPAAAFTLADVPAVADPAITLVNGHPLFERPISLINWYAVGAADITRVVLNTPKVRVTAQPNLRPYDAAAAPTSRQFLPAYWRNPLRLLPVEENQMLMSASAGTGAAYLVAAWFGDNPAPPPQGDILTAHGSIASLTTSALTWGSGVFTLDTPLPAGKYAVLGMDAAATGLAFGRLIFPEQQWRPGAICGAAATFVQPQCFRLGQMGVWGQFASYAQPQFEAFSVAGLAAAAVDIYLDLLRIG